MIPFEYRRPASLADAVRQGTEPETEWLAGGTELLNWLRHDLARPRRVVDLGPLDLAGVTRVGDRIRVGAGTRLADLAIDPLIAEEAPALASAVRQSASPAIRASATLAGNLLQRTRCPYYRSVGPCNRREPGSGCAARAGDQRSAGILGTDQRCVATHPSDPAVALLGLEAELVVAGPAGERRMPVGALHAPDSLAAPTLASGDIITAIEWPTTALARSGRYLKVRDRAGFDFALVAVAGHRVARDGVTAAMSLALGGVAPRPWRCRTAETQLIGRPLTEAGLRAALAAELAEARPLPGNRFKLDLVVGAVIRLFAGDLGR
jgi:xanthine dehydrogenase YagS FAD-binding subunit